MFSRKSLRLLAGAAATAYLLKNPDSYDFIEQNIFLPVSYLLPPEVAHKCALWSIRLRVPPRNDLIKPNMLRTTVFGVHFDNPIGLAAGFDKNCEAIKGLQRLGFGFIEGGSVTPLPQPGNDQPRVFRLFEDSAVINRYGFPSIGADAVAKNFQPTFNFISITVEEVPDEKLQRFFEAHQPQSVKPSTKNDDPNTSIYRIDFRGKFSQSLIQKFLMPSTCKVGINLGINKTSNNPTNDYCVGVEKLGHYADYVVINVSSPNTPGLRDLQRKTELEKMLKHISRRVGKKNKASGGMSCKALLLKISPDLNDDDLQDVVDVVMDPKYGVKGLIVSNTTISRPESLQSSIKGERGGLSGPPLKNLSTEMIKKVFRLTDGRVPIIGVGGVSSAEDVYEKIRAGASLVQLYTGLVYQGLGLVRRMKKGLCELLARDGFINVQMAVGADVPDVTNKTIHDIFKGFESFHRQMLPLELPPVLGNVPPSQSDLVLGGESPGDKSDQDTDEGDDSSSAEE